MRMRRLGRVSSCGALPLQSTNLLFKAALGQDPATSHAVRNDEYPDRFRSVPWSPKLGALRWERTLSHNTTYSSLL